MSQDGNGFAWLEMPLACHLGAETHFVPENNNRACGILTRKNSADNTPDVAGVL